MELESNAQDRAMILLASVMLLDGKPRAVFWGLALSFLDCSNECRSSEGQ